MFILEILIDETVFHLHESFNYSKGNIHSRSIFKFPIMPFSSFQLKPRSIRNFLFIFAREESKAFSRILTDAVGIFIFIVKPILRNETVTYASVLIIKKRKEIHTRRFVRSFPLVFTSHFIQGKSEIVSRILTDEIEIFTLTAQDFNGRNSSLPVQGIKLLSIIWKRIISIIQKRNIHPFLMFPIKLLQKFLPCPCHFVRGKSETFPPRCPMRSVAIPSGKQWGSRAEILSTYQFSACTLPCSPNIPPGES